MKITKEKIQEIIVTVESQIDGIQNDKHNLEAEMEESTRTVQESQVHTELLHEIGIAIQQNQAILQNFQKSMDLFNGGTQPRFSRDQISLFEFYGFDTSELNAEEESDEETTDRKRLRAQDKTTQSGFQEDREMVTEMATSGVNTEGKASKEINHVDDGRNLSEGGNTMSSSSPSVSSHTDTLSEEREKPSPHSPQRAMTSPSLSSQEEKGMEKKRPDAVNDGNSTTQEPTAVDATLASDTISIGETTDKEQANSTPFWGLSLSMSNLNSASMRRNSVSSPIAYSPRSMSPSRMRGRSVGGFGKDGAGAMRDILDEMKREAAAIQTQFRETYTTERNILLEDSARTKEYLAQQRQIEENLRRQYLEQQDILRRNEVELKSTRDELELHKTKHEESISLIETLETQTENLEKALEEMRHEKEEIMLQEQQDKEDLRQHLMSTFSQDNKAQHELMNQMKEQILRRKESHVEEISRLKEVVAKSLSKVHSNELSEKGRRLQSYAEMQLMELENSYYDFQDHKTSIAGSGSDPLDYAIEKLLNSMHLPVPVDIERIAPGEYLMDRRLTMRLVNGEPMVRMGRGYELFASYVRNLYNLFDIGDDDGEEETPESTEKLDALFAKYQSPSRALSSPSKHSHMNRSGPGHLGNGLRSLSPRSSKMLSPRMSHQQLIRDGRLSEVQHSQKIVDEAREAHQRRLGISPRRGSTSPANALPPRPISAFAEPSQNGTPRNANAKRGQAGKAIRKPSTARATKRATAIKSGSGSNGRSASTRTAGSHTPRSSSTPRFTREQNVQRSQRSASPRRRSRSNSRTTDSQPSAGSASPRGTGRLLPEDIGTMSEQEIRHLKRVALKKQIEQMRIRNQRS